MWRRFIGLSLLGLLALALAGCAPLWFTPVYVEGGPSQPDVSLIEQPSSLTDLRPIEVTHVHLEVGVGSPIPVDIFVSGSWPDLCAQIAVIEQRITGSDIDITLLATAADPACPPDFVGLPFRIALPLNTVEMADGDYTVRVNGVAATFTLPVTPPTGDGR